MFIHDLKYHKPQDIDEILSLLSLYGENAKLLAGGTDLILQMKFNKWKQEHIIDIKGVRDLNNIGFEDQYMVIGCNTTLTELLESSEVKTNYNALWYSIHELADVQIRNRGTLVGNLCNASPAADASTPLLAYDAKVLILSAEGERELPLKDFFAGPGKTKLKPNEMVKEIHIPKPNHFTYCSFQKLGRVYDDIAIVNAAVQLKCNEFSYCVGASIAMGAVGPTVIHAPIAESFLVGKRIEKHLNKAVSIQASQESSPITDVRASADYRKRSIAVLIERALNDILENAKGS